MMKKNISAQPSAALTSVDTDGIAMCPHRVQALTRESASGSSALRSSSCLQALQRESQIPSFAPHVAQVAIE